MSRCNTSTTELHTTPRRYIHNTGHAVDVVAYRLWTMATAFKVTSNSPPSSERSCRNPRGALEIFCGPLSSRELCQLAPTASTPAFASFRSVLAPSLKKAEYRAKPHIIASIERDVMCRVMLLAIAIRRKISNLRTSKRRRLPNLLKLFPETMNVSSGLDGSTTTGTRKFRR